MNDIEEYVEKFIAERTTDPKLTPEAFAARFPESQPELLELLQMVELLNSGNEPPPNSSSFDQLPEKLSGFTLETKIGQGGMGLVFRARQELLDRPVAIKLLAPYLALDPERRQAFENEARLVARLHHPHIIQVFGAGYEAGYSYYVMELLAAHPLSLSRTYTARQIAEIGRQSASALSYAHSQNILHRDVKPGNILIDQQDQVHLGDFGLAALLPDNAALTVTSGSREGTIRYMAPEIFLHDRYSFASDQYALGVTLYELWQGHPALPSTSPGQLIRTICEKGIPPLPARNSDLARIINKCLSADPAARYPDLAAVEMEFQRFLNHEPVQATRPSALYRLKLGFQRNPVAGYLTLLLFGLLLVAVIVSTVGYFMVARARDREEILRQRAESNAELARHTLERIYRRETRRGQSSLTLPPSPAAVTLLEDLLPYYEKLNQLDPHSNHSDYLKLQHDLAILAEQANRPQLAVKLYAQLAQQLPQGSAAQLRAQNHQGQALIKLQRRGEALQLWQQLIARNKPQNLDSQLEQVAIMRQLAHYSSGSRQKQLYRRCFRALKQLEPRVYDRRDFKFLLAQLLIDAPQSGARWNFGADPFMLLKELWQHHPYDLAIRQELLRAGLQLNLPNRRHYAANGQKLALALQSAESLLGEFGGDPILIENTAALYEKYIKFLRNRREATKQSNRIIGMMKLLASRPQSSTNAQAAALKFLLQQYQQLAAQSVRRPNNGTRELRQEIAPLIKAYRGPDQAEFERRFQEISEKY